MNLEPKDEIVQSPHANALEAARAAELHAEYNLCVAFDAHFCEGGRTAETERAYAAARAAKRLALEGVRLAREVAP